ncbi:MAG: S-layer homology domain-containing protein [Oscillospiraceae bacterium]|nr:S-layer homology domain-containing protein [Oscillospiraceae bacterium]
MVRNTKKFFCLLLVIAMLFSLTIPAFAEGDAGDTGEDAGTPPVLPTAYLECGDGYPGDVVDCSLLSDDSFSFATMSVTITYDAEKLIPGEVSGSLQMNDSLVNVDTSLPGIMTITYNGTDDIAFNGGTLFDISFSIVDTLQVLAYVPIEADILAAQAGQDEFNIETSGDTVSIWEVDDGLYDIVVTSENREMGHASASVKNASEGDVVTLTADPNKGYRFAGWDTQSKNVRFAEIGNRQTTFTMPKEDVTITAKFVKTTASTRYNIASGDLVGGTFSTRIVEGNNIRVLSNATESTKVLLFATPEAGYYLAGWEVKTYREESVDVYDENSTVASIIMPDDDVIVTPIFKRCDTDAYSLTIHTDGFGSASVESYQYYPGDLVEIEAFADDEFQFGGWSANTEAVEFDRAASAHTTFVMPSENVILTATFIAGEEKFQISFQNIGGGNAATKNGKTEFYEGDKVTIVGTPKTGYRFFGWSTGNLSGVKFNNEYSSTTTFTMPAKDIVITATFVEYGGAGSGTGTGTGGTTGGFGGGTGTTTGSQYQVIFNSTGGSKVTTVRVNANAVLAQPTPPTRDGYFFSGWYIDSACEVKYDFTKPVTHHLTLYAKWTTSLSFTDVDKNTWYYQPIIHLAQNGVINGISSTKFAPNETITRAQVAQILANLSGANLSRYTYVPFEDVLLDAWYYNAIAWAIDAGVIQGKSATTFAPNEPVTRQDLAVLIHRYITNVSGSVLPFTQPEKSFSDQSQIADYAKNAVVTMQRAEIINGKSNNCFDPRGNATRAEASKMIYQLMLLID